jgi:hypothetical protein
VFFNENSAIQAGLQSGKCAIYPFRFVHAHIYCFTPFGLAIEVALDMI